MKTMADRFALLEREIAREKGDFSLFALVLREDVPEKWDLVVAAPWFSSDRKRVLDFFVAEIKSLLGPRQLLDLSRIVVLEASDAAVQALNRAIHVEHGMAEVRDSVFLGLPIRHAYIFSSKSPEPSTTK